MKHLNKIIFIKAANVDYQEIQLNGNVHFTGDQGVGKTTVLRAILFFYNADTQRLGIPKVANKSDFADYYFEFPNSHIIYEVATKEGKYLIWLYKEHNKLCYRFIDSEYKKHFFLEETPKGILPLKPNKVSETILSQTRHSRKIIKFTEYRNIIYGATNNVSGLSRNFKQYAIIESPAYQNIPKTISNIYLNSNLKSDAIKTTIINSISIDDFALNDGKGYKVDLNVLRTQLSDFKQDYNDISAYEKIKKRAGIIIQNYDELIRLEQEKILAAKTLGANHKELTSKIDKLEFDSSELDTKYTESTKQISDLQNNFDNTKTDYDKRIAIEQKNISDTKNKIEHYRTLQKENLKGIDAILDFVSKEKNFEIEKINLENELKLLTSKVESIEEKYKSILQQLENSHNANLNILNGEKSTIKSDSARQQSKIIEQYSEFIEDLRQLFEKQIEEETELQNQLNDKELKLKRQRDKINLTKFYDEDIKTEQKNLTDYNNQIVESTNKINLNKEEIEKLQDKGNHEKEILKLHFENKTKELENKRIDTQEKLDEIDEKLEAFKDSLHEFLNQNYPEWEQTIGKVFDEKILLSQNLSPQIIETNQSFYGVKLNLEEIDINVKTITDYQIEKDKLLIIIEEIKTDFQKEQSEFENQQQKINTKYNQKLKKLNQEILQLKTLISQTEVKSTQTKLRISSLKKEAEKKKISELSIIEPLIKDVSQNIGRSKQKLQDLKSEREKKVREKQDEQKQEINKLKSHFSALEQKLAAQVTEEKQKYQDKVAKVKDDRKKELEGKVDTDRLDLLETDIENLNKNLLSIKKLNQVVAIYNEDKTNFIDKLPIFEATFSKLNSEFNSIKEKYKQENKELRDNQTQIKKELDSINEQLKEQKRQQKEFEDFEKSPFYSDVEYFVEHCEESANEELLTDLIKIIKDLQQNISENIKSLKSSINKFVSPLREGNIFNFPTNFPDDLAYRSFANDLKDFITDNKIDDYKKYIKKNHADLISLIVKHIEQLSSKKKEIDEIISKMNKDFERHNFVGVVQEVVLKADPSENKVFQTFEEIRKFHGENPFGFGELNLFTGLKLEENNDAAFKLLVGLMSNLSQEQNKTEISLEDTFELKFRVVENNKDTGWQTKLADIGSNGTDVLVKAMLYIMLLNVFKEKASKKQKDFKLHCIMDEINIIHPKNIDSLIDFANDRGIWMINGSPIETNAMAYKYVYDFEKTSDSITHANRLIAQN
ncbi:ATP-binding protein [Carboxylicivirga taeanensis]|uniref:ATP-binding protein n=1 Tax=Carboxylicivirga taeanensis TaxID=1416875 RepID=UPI003F6DB8B7